MRKFYCALVLTLICLTYRTADAQINNEVCYCSIYPLMDTRTLGFNPEFHYSERYTHNGIAYAINKSAIPDVKILPTSVCEGNIKSVVLSSTRNALGVQENLTVQYLYLPGQILIDRNKFNDKIEELKSSLTSYIDRRHEKVKETLLANINRINQEEMNALITENSFLLKNGIEQVLRDSAFVMVEKSIVEVVDDPEFVREKLIKALEEYETPADTQSTDTVEGSPN